MKYSWNKEKNLVLIRDRNISFEDIVNAIDDRFLITTTTHQNPFKYPHQKLLFVLINNYVHVIPCIIKNDECFMKTIYKSRVANKIYKQGVKKYEKK